MGYWVYFNVAYGCILLEPWLNEDNEADRETCDPDISTRWWGCAACGPTGQILVIEDSEKSYNISSPDEGLGPGETPMSLSGNQPAWDDKLRIVAAHHKLQVTQPSWHVWVSGH